MAGEERQGRRRLIRRGCHDYHDTPSRRRSCRARGAQVRYRTGEERRDREFPDTTT